MLLLYLLHLRYAIKRSTGNYLENGSRRWFQVDVVAQCFQSVDQPSLDCLAVALIEVVCSQILIGTSIAEQVVSDEQDTMRHGHSGAPPTAAGGQPPVLGAQGRLRAACRPCGVRQGTP